MTSETSNRTFCGTMKRTNARRKPIAGEGSVFADAINAFLYRADKIKKHTKAGKPCERQNAKGRASV